MRRLGLNVGANGIGWCLIENDASIVAVGSRIFGDGQDWQSGMSLAINRHQARADRRRRDRYIGRRRAFMAALVKNGLMPTDIGEAKLLADRDPYDLRARALSEPLAPHEIGRALFHLNQRRGFKSSLKVARQLPHGDQHELSPDRPELDDAIAAAGVETLGQFLAMRETKRMRMTGNDQNTFLPRRQHYEEEFARIWSAQARHHPALLSDLARDSLYRILFFQRPLKSVNRGVCVFVSEEARLRKAHPLFQERRLYEAANQLEVTGPGRGPRKLSLAERDKLIPALRAKAEVSFRDLAKLIGLDELSLGMPGGTRTHLTGNEVNAVMGNKRRFGAAWSDFDLPTQSAIVQRVIEDEDMDILHADLVELYDLNDRQATAVTLAPLPEGYDRLGETASKCILEKLRLEVIGFGEAVSRCGWSHSSQHLNEPLARLPYYGELLTRDIPPGSQVPSDPPEIRWGKVAKPALHIGLRQLEKLINAIIDTHGRPDQITVEVAHELKLDQAQKAQRAKRLRRNADAVVARNRELARLGMTSSGENRALLRIWEEANPDPLERCCPYCGGPIDVGLLLSGEVVVDYVLPFSRTLDSGNSNKVVSHHTCSLEKSNRAPFETWGGDPVRWAVIGAQVRRMPKSKQWRFAPDAMKRFEGADGFVERQFHDTHYFSRLVGRYLSALYPSHEERAVRVVSGKMTRLLRRSWSLDSLLPDYEHIDRELLGEHTDLRHCAIDAAVVAATTHELFAGMAQNAARIRGESDPQGNDIIPEPWEGFRADLDENLAGVTVSHRADHGLTSRPARSGETTAGQLHNETAYGFTGKVTSDGKMPIVVHRIPLKSLKASDIVHPGRIVDPTLRDRLRTCAAGATGKELESALERFANDDPVFAGIRRVRVHESANLIPIRDSAGKVYKGYKSGSNARFDVWQLPNGKWVPDIVSMFDAHQSGERERPHPAAKKILSLRRNDMLAIEREGHQREIVRVVKFSTIGTIALAGNSEGGALKTRDALPSGQDPFKYILSSAGVLKKLKARQLRVDVLGRVFDPGPR